MFYEVIKNQIEINATNESSSKDYRPLIFLFFLFLFYM